MNAGKQIALRFAIAYILSLAAFFLLPTRFAVWTLARPYVGALGINAYPLLLIPVIFGLVLFAARRNIDWAYPKYYAPSKRQTAFALLLFILLSLFAHWVTHPPYARFLLMQRFVTQFPYGGESFLAYSAYSASLLPLMGALFAVYSLRFLRIIALPLLVGTAVFLFYLYAHVIEIAYFRLSIKPILLTIKWLLSLLPLRTTILPVNGFIAVNDFGVHLGPACTDFSTLALFMGLWSFVLFRSHIRSCPSILSMLIGMGILWSLNILRILLILLIGLHFPVFATTLFHGSIGGLLFLTFFALYLKYSLPFLRQRR